MITGCLDPLLTRSTESDVRGTSLPLALSPDIGFNGSLRATGAACLAILEARNKGVVVMRGKKGRGRVPYERSKDLAFTDLRHTSAAFDFDPAQEANVNQIRNSNLVNIRGLNMDCAL